MANAMTAPPTNENLPSPSNGGGAAGTARKGGFFSIYKKGQGYWTRLLTAASVGAILLVVANWIYRQGRPRFTTSFLANHTRDAAEALGRNVALGIAAIIVVGGAILAWSIMNSPKGAEFLITTDSEMKKVNWASRKEVFGSTRVVVLFLIFICAFLFLADILFGWFFNMIGVLKTGPFGG